MRDHGSGPDGEDHKNATYGSHCVNVWDIQSGHRVATLRSKAGGTIKSLATIPHQNMLLTGHSSGKVHAWKYDSFEHLVGFRALEDSLGISFHLHETSLVVMNMTHLIMLKDPTQLAGGGSKETSTLSLGRRVNCQNCGYFIAVLSARRRTGQTTRKCAAAKSKLIHMVQP